MNFLHKSLATFGSLLLVASLNAKPIDHQWNDCQLSFDGETLTLSNSLIKRTWVCGERLLPTSLVDVDQKIEWLQPIDGAKAIDGWKVSHEEKASSAVAKKALQVRLEHAEKGLTYLIRVFPRTAAIDIEQLHETDLGANSIVDELKLADPSKLGFTHVTLKDHTDRNLKGLVFPEAYDFSKAFQSSANIAFIENAETKSGLLFIKLSPLPHARAKKIEHDFNWDGSSLKWKGPGFNSISKRSYPCAVICYDGGRAGRIAAGQRYQRSIRQYVPGRDGQLLSNTWGDRSRDAKISQPFLITEIKAGKAMGVDVMQVDDGWQRGTTQNSAVARSKSGVWSGFWKADPKFWWPHEERLPNGLEPVAEAAKEHGLKMGLWYAPDSDDDFGNWERDADRILELHRSLGVKYFKLDSIVMTTEIAEKRVLMLMNKVIEATDGNVVIDLDVTAGIRPGYLGAVEVGTVFVENRYTDWATYWPHKTLRNFWQLSEYIDPVRVRMEFLNNVRNTEQKKYKENELAPVTYPPAYLFASVMFSSPLAWFEVSELPEEYAKDVGALVKVWKDHRVSIHGGDIIPIGDAPDGSQWAGLCSIAHDRKSGHAVIFRELNEQAEATFEIPLLDELKTVEILHGDGEAAIEDGKLKVKLDKPRSYIFLKF